MDKVETLGDFIWDQMKKRGMGEREFARFVKVAHNTLGAYLNPNPKKPIKPSTEVLMKLARATNTDICALFALVAPDLVIAEDTEARMLATQISSLSSDERRLVDAALTAAILKRREKPD